MRLSLMFLIASAGALTACNQWDNVQCEQDSNCDLSGGGVCTTAGTGGHWCAYPDLNCPSGYRYSVQQVGDGVSGACVIEVDTGSPPSPSPPPASCVGLPTTCGANRNDNCCNSLEVPGGTYYRSYDLAGDFASGNMNYPATVSNFRLDKYEVTVGRFRAFLEAGMGTQAHPPGPNAGARPNIAGSGWDASWNPSLAATTAQLVTGLKCESTFQTWTDLPGGNEDRPINCITWYEAMTFCAWDGGYLPTEAEWNYTATGGDLQRAYPWSSRAAPLAFDSSYASYAEVNTSPANCLGDGIPGCAVTDLVVVGTKPAGNGRWGQSDLGGNVSEWLLDKFTSTYVSPCTDCADLIDPLDLNARMIRSGAFNAGPAGMRTGRRSVLPPSVRGSFMGVRCARASSEARAARDRI